MVGSGAFLRVGLGRWRGLGWKPRVEHVCLETDDVFIGAC